MTMHTHTLDVGLARDTAGNYLAYVKKLPAVYGYAKSESAATKMVKSRCIAYLNVSTIAHSKLDNATPYAKTNEIVRTITIHCH